MAIQVSSRKSCELTLKAASSNYTPIHTLTEELENGIWN